MVFSSPNNGCLFHVVDDEDNNDLIDGITRNLQTSWYYNNNNECFN